MTSQCGKFSRLRIRRNNILFMTGFKNSEPSTHVSPNCWSLLCLNLNITENETVYCHLWILAVERCFLYEPKWMRNKWSIYSWVALMQETHGYVYKRKHKKCNTLHWSWLRQTFTICVIKILYWQTHELQSSKLKRLLPRMQQSHFVQLPSCDAQKVCSPSFCVCVYECSCCVKGSH